MGMLGIVSKKLAEGAQTRFFSQAARSAENLQRKTGNAAGFKNDLTGKGQVKPDELKAMGFDEHFGDRKDITKEEVQQFINNNQVQIKETVLGSLDSKPYGLYNDDDMLVEAFATRAEADAALDAVPQEVFDRGEFWRSGEVGGGNNSKFGKYTLEGGDNYRELLLQDGSRIAGREQLRADIKDADDRIGELQVFHQLDPSKDYADELQQAVNDRDGILAQLDNYPNQFVQYSHFEQPDVLAHLRMKDRVDADGNKTLLIEEAQSDWHQTGGDRGYVNESEYADLITEERRLNEILSNTDLAAGESWAAKNAPDLDSALEKARSDFAMAREKARGNPGVDHTESIETARDNLRSAKLKLDDAFQADYLKQNGVRAGDAYEQAQSEMQILRAELDPMHDAVPDAPFKTDDKSSWYNLALKRGLLEAVEGGYDKLALTTGRQQAERYDLSNQIGSMRLREEIIPNNKASGGDPLGSRKMFLLDAFDLDGNKVINRRIDNPEKELPNIIGKEVSKKLLNQEAGVLYPDVPSSTAKVKILNGLDLSVGGEGMKQFYDRTLPNALNKMVKQDGVKVSESNLIGKTPSKTEIASASDREELITLRDKIFNGDDTSPTHDRYNELLAKYQPKPRTDAVHSIDITSKMRERVKKGLPLFATDGAAIGLTEMMSQQQQEDQRSGLFNSLQY